MPRYVVKTAADAVLRGEIFFYEHMPDDVAHLFPALISSFNAPGKARSQQRSPRQRSPAEPVHGSNPAAGGGSGSSPDGGGGGAWGAAPPPPAASQSSNDEDPTAAAAAAALSHGAPPSATAEDAAPALAGVSSMTLSRIKGVTFSHLVTNRSLTPGRLILLLQALRQLHSSAGDPASLLPAAELALGANYLPKLRKRFASHRELYTRLSDSAEDMYSRIETELASFEAERRWQPANVSHADTPRAGTPCMCMRVRVHPHGHGHVPGVRACRSSTATPSSPTPS